MAPTQKPVEPQISTSPPPYTYLILPKNCCLRLLQGLRATCARTDAGERSSNGRRACLGDFDFDFGGRRALVAASRRIDRGHSVEVAPA